MVTLVYLFSTDTAAFVCVAHSWICRFFGSCAKKSVVVENAVKPGNEAMGSHEYVQVVDSLAFDYKAVFLQVNVEYLSTSVSELSAQDLVRLKASSVISLLVLYVHVGILVYVSW